MKTDEQLLAEANALDAQYADAAAHDEKMQAEAFEEALRELMDAARAVLNSEGACEDDLSSVLTESLETLKAKLEVIESWVDGEEESDPRAMGWVDGKGRP